MRMHYLIEKLDKEELSKVWCALKDIKETLVIKHPSNATVLISLHPEDCNISPAKVYGVLEDLQRKGIFKILKRKKLDEGLDSVPVRIINEEKFHSEYKKVENQAKQLGLIKSQKDTVGNLLITRDSNGDFYYRGKLINFQDEENIYYKVFAAVFEKSDANGFCSYHEIDKFLIQSGEDKLKDVDKINKRITNAVANLFRFTKNLPNKAPSGKPIIKVKRGRGLIFNNPRI